MYTSYAGLTFARLYTIIDIDDEKLDEGKENFNKMCLKLTIYYRFSLKE